MKIDADKTFPWWQPHFIRYSENCWFVMNESHFIRNLGNNGRGDRILLAYTSFACTPLVTATGMKEQQSNFGQPRNCTERELSLSLAAQPETRHTVFTFFLFGFHSYRSFYKHERLQVVIPSLSLFQNPSLEGKVWFHSNTCTINHKSVWMR